MAEGFVLNIPKEMLDRLQKADEKIEKLDKNSRRVGENIRLAFMESAKGVDKFIGSLNSAQKILDGFKDRKINVGLNLDAKAIDDLKKQLSTAGVNIPVGVTGTGGGNVPNMQSYLDSIVKITESLATMVNNLPKTTSGSNVSNKGETSIPKTNEELIKSVNLWQTLQREVDKYNQELDKVNKEIKRVEEIRKNIASGKGGIYNPKEHQENINRAKDLQDLINKHQAEQKAIIEKNKALAETFNRQKELKNVGTQQQDIELLRLNEDLTKQEQQALELEKQRTKELKEYEKLLIRIAQLKQEQDKVTKIQNTSTDSNVQAQAQQQQQRIQQLLTQANSRRVELENKLGNDVLQAQHKAGAKELEYLRKKENEKLKEADRALKELMSTTKRWQQQQDRDQIAFYNTRKGALQYSQNAKTINEQIKALNYLRTAQKSLDVSTSQGKKQFYELEREIKKTENALRRYGVQLGGVREQSSHLFNISQQLGRALSLMFSVSQIGQYISKMVNVRKDMELQQRSLQVLLQSKDKANELWNQTLDLAVKSPFRVKELVTYTKQLAAYRIESDKLFETNKMLADVSAGLGVDMQRLILAFGQVKSASFLRGCLGKDTPIRLYNDDIKEVQNIVVGDVIMGDDDTPRNVKEVIYGKEQMYIVRQGDNGDDYRVNENHILTLKDKITDTIVDIYVKDYLKDKERYNGVKIGKNNNIIDYPIELIKDNIDEYFGFVIDGNKRFLLGDGTITHNTELRQFTEAGIPMLEELSKYFEELYGRSVSVAEVFDMISKRMVTFTDVEAVFQRMTSAGGVFFNMQEELSQTTAGMISNLQDSIDLMFNEIGKKNQGIINTAIKWARGLVNNWETVGMVMKGTLVTLLLYKAATMDVDKMLLKIMYKWDDIKNIPVNFTTGNAVMLALTAFIALLIKWRREADQYNKAIEEVNKAHDKFRDSISNVALGFSNLFSQGVDDIEEYKGKLQELVGIAQQSYNIEMDFEIKNLESIDEVSRKFDELKEKILSFDNLSLEFDLDFTKQSDRGWALFQDYLETDLKDLSSAQKDIKALASEIQGLMSGTIKDVAELERLNKKSIELSMEYHRLSRLIAEGDDDNKITEYLAERANIEKDLKSLDKPINDLKSKLKGVDIDIAKSLFPRGVDESEYEYLQRITNGIIKLQSEAKKVGVFNVLGIEKGDRYDFAKLGIYKRFKDYTTDLQEATKELTAFFEKAHIDIANLVNTSLRGTTLGFEPLDLIDAIKEATDEDYGNLSDVIAKELRTRGVEVNEELNKLLQQIVKAQDPNKVNEEFKRLVDILNKQSLDEEVSDYVYNSLKKIATDKELDETTFHEILKQAEKYFGTNALKDNEGNIILETLYLDLIPKIKPVETKDLEQWQKDLQAKLEKNKDLLQGSIPMVTFQTTQEKALKDAEDAWKATEGLIKRIENAQKQSDNELKSWYSQYNVDELKKKMQVEKDIWTELGGSEDKENASEKRIKEQIRLIKELYQEYQKLSKEYGSSNAKGIVTKSFETLLNDVGLNINNIDFTNLQGVINSLTMLRGQAATAGKEASQELEKAIGETSVELGLILKVKEREETAKEIENMFSDYEMTIDLKKLDIPQNLAEDLFDVNWTDLGDIKQRLEQERSALEEENKAIQEQIANAYKNQVSQETIESLKLQAQGNKARLDDIEKFYQKWNEAERKSTEERLKTYYKYLLNEQHERVKIRLETLRKLQEVESTSKYTDTQKETITNKLKEEERESLAKQTWKDFETSPMYMQLFDDIENMSKGSLEQMIVTMDGLKTELQSMGLPASNLKEILSQINKVEEELERRNPFRNFAENANIALNRSKELARLEEQRASQQKDYDYAKASYDNIQASLVENEKILETLDKESLEYQVQKSLVDKILKSTNYWANEVDKAESNLAETNKQINNINDSSKDFYEQLKNIGSITKSVVDGVFQITDAMSWLPEETQLSLERMKGLSDSAFTIAGGIGSIMSGDVIGGITSLISGVSGLVSLFMEWSSGAKEAAIQTEKQGRLLTDLQNKYDRLNKAIDEAWNVAQIKQYNAELQKNLQQQIIAQKAIIEAQKSVKGANDYGSEQWLELKEAEEELQNLYDTQEELQKNIYSKLTGGIMDDVLSTTESFVDAWYDAFKETGDGLKGLEDSFNEMLLNLVKRQAAMKIASRFIDEWDNALERYASEGGLSNSEIEYYANKVKNDLPALSSQLETFFSSFDNVLGDASGNLSGLQRGIQGVTEQQADILASYLNSIRFIVSDSNSQLKALLAAQTSTSASNPIVAQLQVIAQQASAINTLLNTLVKGGHGLGGNGLKVFI